jgi:hypothetical protein
MSDSAGDALLPNEVAAVGGRLASPGCLLPMSKALHWGIAWAVQPHLRLMRRSVRFARYLIERQLVLTAAYACLIECSPDFFARRSGRITPIVKEVWSHSDVCRGASRIVLRCHLWRDAFQNDPLSVVSRAGSFQLIGGCGGPCLARKRQCRSSVTSRRRLLIPSADRRITIGKYPVLSLAEARDNAKRLLAEFTLGRLRPHSLRYPVGAK